MSKTLVILSHPTIASSTVHKRWIQELKKFPDIFTVHELYEKYPNGNIDVEKEQILVSQHQQVLFQFPLYWFTAPPLMKKWFDDVLTHGWAYGSKGKAFVNKPIAFAISVGGSEDEYQGSELYHHSFVEVAVQFKMIADYIKADYHGITTFYGAEHNGTLSSVEQKLDDYIDFLLEFNQSDYSQKNPSIT